MAGRKSDLAGVATGYALGSLPFGVWLARTARGLDVREHGSGSSGSTNVLRVAGPTAAAAVFALDVGKGTAAVLGARALGADTAGQAAAGIAAVIGHSWPALAHFRGGKSVATAFGGLLAMSPLGSVCAVAGGLTALGLTRTVSVGSLAAAGSGTVGAGSQWIAGEGSAPFLFAVAATGVIVVRHSANLRRLWGGREPQLHLGRRLR